jgi:hypothetical protein
MEGMEGAERTRRIGLGGNGAGLGGSGAVIIIDRHE